MDTNSTPNINNNLSDRILKKPLLITKSELLSLGKDIKLVGYNPLDSLITNSDKTFSPKMLNWVESYAIDGVNKTLFYTEVNTELKIGDRVFIINGNYDSDVLISSNKYRKGRDGYKILFIDKCKIVLDINYTGVLPFNDEEADNFINVHYIKNISEFKNANRQITTRSGGFDYKFDRYQNNIAFIDNNYTTNQNWGLNGGVSGAPGFFVRNGISNWTNITTDFITNGSYSYALSATYSNNNRIRIVDGDFKYNGKEFKDGFIYKWSYPEHVGDQSEWIIDLTYFRSFISKNNFRGGNFKGTWNSGLFGQQSKKIIWEGDGSIWNTGTLLNTNWIKGKINSLYSSIESYFSSFDNSGLPYQKINDTNNAGRGYNFIVNSNIESSNIVNGSIDRTIIGEMSATYSVVEDEILEYKTEYKNNIQKAFFDTCEFNNAYIYSSEIKNTRSINSKFENTKSINSYFKNSVFKNSNYNSDNIIKIFTYDEFIASEYPTLTSTFSSINDSVQKVYKFYINRDGYERLRSSDIFYIKGLKINDNSKNVINFFDKKFKIGSWVDYSEDNFTITNQGKRGFEYSAFLSTPLDNSYKFTSVHNLGVGMSKIEYHTSISGTNSNNLYSIDIWVKRYDIDDVLVSENIDFNKDSTPSLNIPIIDPYDYGNIIDISNAYIVDSDFDSGLFENSDWNSGSHINWNNDLNITIQSATGGFYNLSINANNNIVATTSYNINYPEGEVPNIGDVLFLDSVDINNGTIERIPDTYKIISNVGGVYELSEMSNTNQITSITPSIGYFYTNGAENRYGHLKNLKISKSNIKSGLFRRSYISESLIQNSDYDEYDKDYNNLEKIRNLVISDCIFSNNSNILSSATYLYSFFLNGSDIWYNGIIQDSIWNGMTFSNGTIKGSTWIDGVFTGGYFYNSRGFNARPGSSYLSNSKNSFYKNGYSLPNNRESWRNGIFKGGEFQKSDWECGTFSDGKFWYSKWYNGVFENGTIGSNNVSISDTWFYNGTVSYAIVENATIFSIDSSSQSNIPQTISWIDGVFNNGVFGSDTTQNISNTSTWNDGIFNGGQFISNGKWKDGIFNGGKFISSYGWTQSDYLTQSYYGWENGIFNGGEFGNGEGLTNSIWNTGEFNGGIFKGRTWNDGVFLYGEFQGSGTNPIGGLTCASASVFVDSFSQSYWGLWRNGYITSSKDKFIKDKKIYTTEKRAIDQEQRRLKAKFKNALWISGTFSHPSGEMSESVWLDGSFESGIFKGSSFNPYVKRNGSSQSSFNLSDTCFWENGNLEDSDFYISKWKNGNFIMGTATGAIWQNGVVSYMNAFNVFWEDGIWRNGNWYGSSFEFGGYLSDDYTNQILFRGMSWSGTSSCHLWNIFLETTDNESIIVSNVGSTPSGITGLTNPDTGVLWDENNTGPIYN